VKPAPSTSSGPLTAAGKAILLRQQMIAEEEARVKRLQEEAEQQAREEEARLDAEQKAIEEEKERKRKQKQDKVDAQKAAGTYMTKAEKEKAKKAQARLESMKKAGLISVDPGTGAVKPAGGNSVASKIPAAVAASSPLEEVEPAVKDAATVAVALPPPPPAAAIAAEEEETGAAEQEDWDLDDDWEANIEKITSKVESLKEKVSEDVEDMLMVDEKKSHERLKQLGLDRAKREEEARVKR
jgi:translation initiation factor 5B